jgi:hypothetical protein
VKERHIGVFVLNLPFGVIKTSLGGSKGYLVVNINLP